MAADTPVTVRLSRLSRRGVILGHSGLQVLTLALAVASLIVGLYVGGGTGLLVTGPIWVLAMTAAWLPVAGRPAVEWLPAATVWTARRAARQTRFRRRITAPVPHGSLGLPGDAAALRHLTDTNSGAVLVHDPHERRLVAIAEVTHRSFVLLDPADQHRRIHGWGQVLATACRSTRLARVQVLERTLAGSGSGLSRWWATTGTADGSWPATTYASLIERAGPAAERHVTTIAIALDLQAAARPIRTAGGGLRGAAAVLAQEMTTLSTALAAADLAPVRWLPAADLAAIIRSAYDPALATRLDDHPTTNRAGTDHSGLGGPVAVEEHWDRLQSDSAHHAVLWVSEWPRTEVDATFLAPVLLSSGVTRAFTLICDPVPAARAARDLRRKKTEYLADAAQRARIGQLEDVGQTAEYHDVIQQEADLTAGHGVLRYAGLLAISAPTDTALDAAVAEVEQAAVQASCETRRLVGQQAQAFLAAALPLCRGI